MSKWNEVGIAPITEKIMMEGSRGVPCWRNRSLEFDHSEDSRSGSQKNVPGKCQRSFSFVSSSRFICESIASPVMSILCVPIPTFKSGFGRKSHRVRF